MRYLFILSLLFISCGYDDPVEVPVYKLQVRSSGKNVVFQQVALPNNLLSVSNDNQIFELTDLKETGNLTATVIYSCEGGDNDSKDLTLNFYEDKTTVIKVDKVIRSQAGCVVAMIVLYEP